MREIDAKTLLGTELLTPRDVARILRCSLAYSYKIAERHQVPCIRIPCPGTKKTLLRFKMEDIERLINESYHQKQ